MSIHLCNKVLPGKIGGNVALRLGKNPDEDMVFFSKAKAVVQSGGGYSWLLTQVAAYFEGKVIIKRALRI